MDFRRSRLPDLAGRVRSREQSAREVVQACLDRIERLDPHLRSFVATDPERSLAEAAEIDRRIVTGGSVGPLAGVPLAVKDLEDAAGFRTTYGSALRAEDPVAEGDSVLVARLRAAGCVVVGKTNTPEYGHKAATDNPLFGPTGNPWDRRRSPGGSSGGSSAALAAGLVPLATGSDGGGSIRIPAAVCGMSGIKTSQGRVPNGGPNPPGSGLFSVKGPMTLRILDAAYALDVCVGPHPTDPFSLPRSGAPWYEAVAQARPPTSVVYSPTLGFTTVDPAVAAVVEGAVGRLAAAGVEVEVVDDVWPESPLRPWLVSWCAARARTQGHLRDTGDWLRIDPTLRAQIEFGLQVSGVDVLRSIDAVHELNLQLEGAFERAPLLLTPTVAGQTPLSGRDGMVDGTETPSWLEFTFGFNLTRNPAGTVCCGFLPDGMPVGLQVVGRQREDIAVLQALAAFEDIFGTEAQADLDPLEALARPSG
jgi:aspartyl-tRNA(Asn)/glutamyl-tRNA(Gln) amidotransferase subunit A